MRGREAELETGSSVVRVIIGWARSAYGEAAEGVARVSVSRGEAFGFRPTRAGYHEDRDTIQVIAQRLGSVFRGWLYSNQVGEHENARLGSSRKCGGCGQRTDRIERAGPPLGGPVRSIRKNSRSSRFRSYGPPLREERFSSFKQKPMTA